MACDGAERGSEVKGVKAWTSVEVGPDRDSYVCDDMRGQGRNRGDGKGCTLAGMGANGGRGEESRRRVFSGENSGYARVMVRGVR